MTEEYVYLPQSIHKSIEKKRDLFKNVNEGKDYNKKNFFII